jgi:hypothetical protein
METTATTMETTATTMEASTSTEATTTAAVSGSPCYGSERHEGDTNY